MYLLVVEVVKAGSVAMVMDENVAGDYRAEWNENRQARRGNMQIQREKT